MLFRFVVSNFLSFDQETEFNMLAGSFKTHKGHLYSAGKVDVLKAAAIYGANGAGKSNFIKSLEFLQEAVSEGELPFSTANKKFRLNKGAASKPSSFELEFSFNKRVYSFGISVQGLVVTEEWLYETGAGSEPKLIFERKTGKSGRSSIKVASKYQKTSKSKLLIELMEENLLKGNELLLGKTEMLKIKELELVRHWIAAGIVIIHPGSKYKNLVPAISLSDRFKSFANDLLQTLDTGVSKLDVEEIDFDSFISEYDDSYRKEVMEELEKENMVVLRDRETYALLTHVGDKYTARKLVSIHKDNLGENIVFDLIDESDGTKRILDFIPAFDHILNGDYTFIIDEIDQSLHPSLSYSLVSKIMAAENTKGQFIFTTHESNLLDLEIFRPDEIWFVEKDKKLGSTHLYPLSDFKPRYDLDIRKGYLKGRFGAIPFLAPLEDLNWNQDGI